MPKRQVPHTAAALQPSRRTPTRVKRVGAPLEWKRVEVARDDGRHRRRIPPQRRLCCQALLPQKRARRSAYKHGLCRLLSKRRERGGGGGGGSLIARPRDVLLPAHPSSSCCLHFLPSAAAAHLDIGVPRVPEQVGAPRQQRAPRSAVPQQRQQHAIIPLPHKVPEAAELAGCNLAS
jgi:hypothetical protein